MEIVKMNLYKHNKNLKTQYIKYKKYVELRDEYERTLKRRRFFY